MGVRDIIIKVLCLTGALACYVLLVFFHDDIFTTFEKLVTCAVFSGFLVLYIAFALGTFMGREVDSDLNSAWALYGVAAYLGSGCLCFIQFQGRSESKALIGIFTGVVACIQAVLLIVDVVFLQIFSA